MYADSPWLPVKGRPIKAVEVAPGLYVAEDMELEQRDFFESSWLHVKRNEAGRDSGGSKDGREDAGLRSRV